MKDNAFVQEGMFFRCHHKIVRIVLVVDNVFQIDRGLLLKFVEELRIVDFGNATDFCMGKEIRSRNEPDGMSHLQNSARRACYD